MIKDSLKDSHFKCVYRQEPAFLGYEVSKLDSLGYERVWEGELG